MLTAGWVWQRQRALNRGLSLGYVAPDDFAVDDLPRKYRGSFFFRVTYWLRFGYFIGANPGSGLHHHDAPKPRAMHQSLAGQGSQR